LKVFDRDLNVEFKTIKSLRDAPTQGQCYFSSGSLGNNNSCRRGYLYIAYIIYVYDLTKIIRPYASGVVV